MATADVDAIPKETTDENDHKNIANSENNTVPGESPTKVFITSGSNGHGNVVAAHYNTLEEKGLDERFNSPIFYMRNFNNWIKSMLINEYLGKVRDDKTLGAPFRVLDLCCGKGGDLLKWRKGSITHLICADIASVSVEQCENRYNDMKKKSPYERGVPIFTAEFIAADCTKVRLREKYKDASVELDLVSCQFGFHYSFESISQAECMIRNVAECLRPGGYFIGTIPDAYDIVTRCKKSNSNSFGNDIFKVQLQFNPDTEGYPLFGAKYDFHLEGVVDCPEFLVHFPLFVKLAAKHGLKLIHKERFEEYFGTMRDSGKSLFGRMKCFETYPPQAGTNLMSAKAEDYGHVEKFLEASGKGKDKHFRVGTMTKSEWEASSIYLVFAFKKLKTSWDADGKPVYSDVDK